MSLFQGTESIKVNTSLDRAAEQEVLADQMRHKEEVSNIILAFFFFFYFLYFISVGQFITKCF